MSNPAPKLDERQGWTSASNASADFACPGRHLAQQGLPDEPEGELTAVGRQIHAALALQFVQRDPGNNFHRDNLSGLTVEQRHCYSQCQQLRRKLLELYFGSLITQVNGEDRFAQFNEQRYWAKFTLNGRVYQHSGQADTVFRCGPKALVLDFKTAPGEVPESSRNLQLRDLACLVRGNLPRIEEIAVAIVQPMVEPEPKLCVYTPAELDRATKEMFDRVVRSNDSNSPRVAGELQCKYCRAKRLCVPYQKWAGQLTPPAVVGLMSVPMAQWNGDQLAQFCNALLPAQKFLDDAKDFIRQKLQQEPDSIPGWGLAPGRMMEKITDAQKVFERFHALGGSVEKFMACITVGNTKLREALSALSGAKGKALEAAYDTLTDGLVEKTRTAPSLKRKEKANP